MRAAKRKLGAKSEIASDVTVGVVLSHPVEATTFNIAPVGAAFTGRTNRTKRAVEIKTEATIEVVLDDAPRAKKGKAPKANVDVQISMGADVQCLNKVF